MSEESPHDQQGALTHTDPDPQMIQGLFHMENRRIDVERDRVQLGLKMVEAHEASDQRQYDFHMAQLTQTFQDRKDGRKSLITIIWAILVFFMFGVAGLMGLLFFGTDFQQDMALEISKLLGAALGGGGIIWLARSLFKKAATMV